MFIRRLSNLFGGKLTRWLKRREARDPEAVYEAAINERLRRYQQLKNAAAGVIFMREKLERELKHKLAELGEIQEQVLQAADLDEDGCALILIQRQHELEAENDRLRAELTQLTAEAEQAKHNLLGFKHEIDRLRREKTTMVARLRNAQARIRIQHSLEELSYEDDLRALNEVRDSINQTLAEAGVQTELQGSEIEQKLDEIKRRAAQSRAQAELDELKRRRRLPLAPLNVFADQRMGGAAK
jgi:phage shock protein A